MVEVQYSPTKKIVVHEIIKSELSDFIKMKVQPRLPNMQAMPFRWIDGIVFTFMSTIPTEQLINEHVRDGVIHWDHIEFAEMPTFQNVLVNTENGATWPVIDGSNNTAVCDVITWLKNQPQWSTSITSIA
jgi:hypothetical protein